MKPSRMKQQIFTTSAIVLMASLLFIIVTVHLLQNVKDTQTLETTTYLSEVATQYKNSIINQMEGDLQTLEGIAVFLDDEVNNPSLLLEKLKLENQQNSFSRMGFVDTNYQGTVLDSTGAVYEQQDFRDEGFVQEAMEGKSVVSTIMQDKFSSSSIIGYAVPVYADGQLAGVLTAINTTETFFNIINVPLFSNQGSAYIMDQDANLLIGDFSEEGFQEYSNLFAGISLDEDVRETLKQKKEKQEIAAFTFHYQGEEFWGTIMPIGFHDWYIVGMVPTRDINQNFDYMIQLFYASILVITAIFLTLFLYISHIERKGRLSVSEIAFHDKLTGSYNKTGFLQEADKTLRKDPAYTLIMLDIRNFKFINEIFGHERGDALLKHIADVLKKQRQGEELYFRSHADCFGFLMHATQPDYIRARTMQIMDDISLFQVSIHQNYPIICNCGIKIHQSYSQTGDVETLIDRAAMALQKNKGKHENSLAFYDDALFEKAKRESMIENRMDDALKHGEFIAYIQPKVRLLKETICSGEALIRWQSPHAFLTPDEFIPLFEKNGFITKLDLFVFEEVCKWQKEWKEKGYPPITIAVNQSRRIFYQDDYVSKLQEILHRYQADPSLIILEITEGIVMKYPETLEAIIKELHTIGFIVSMDDFGSGYSSLNALRQLSIDEIKLDRLFLAQTAQTAKSRLIMKNIVQLAKDLSITTVAEGAESLEDIVFLKSIGCDIAQGYHYFKPMKKEDFEKIAFPLSNN